MIIFNSVVVIVNRIVYNNINIIIVVGNLGDAIMSDINVLLEKAVNETAELSDGEVFFLRDLFTDLLYLRTKLLKSTDDVRFTDIAVAIYQNRHNIPITFT